MPQRPLTNDAAPTELSASQRALLAARVRASKDGATRALALEPIAIVGQAFRFPGGANDPEALWRLLAEGREVVGEPPPGRFAGRAPHRAGYLDGVDQFDPAFFGISPREARAMDPQHRLVLEVACEALERAGLPLERIAGTEAGVFLGMYNSDYGMLQLADPRGVHDAHLSVGFSAAANRLSYFLDVHGPSLVVDTACSSALLAVHLACQSLRGGESSVALAGGVNLVLRPELTETYRRWGMLAPDGRCKAFDARADGYVRGEGCAFVVLKRFSDALAAGDPVLALIYGSAVGQDGRTQSVTAPNGRAQASVMRRALANAGLVPEQVTYIEAHGTGTPVGDPIEFEALREVYGAARPCLLGAVKANVGHLEAASGMAGLAKAVLALQRHAVPPQPNFTAPNPLLDLGATSFRVPTALTPWEPGGARYAAVSSFGAGGTNVHLVLAEAPAPPAPAAEDGRPHLFTLSAREGRSLDELTRATAEALGASTAPLHDLAYTATARRTHHDHRLALVASSRAELAAKLGAHAAGEAVEGLALGRLEASGAPRVAFVFPGQGGQWAGMGRRLLAEDAAFRDAVEACDAALRPYLDVSVTATLRSGEAAAFERIDVLQPTLFALQVGLVAAWRALGVDPEATVGHSMGEVAAAHVAGALSLDDAARVIARRSHLLRRVSGRGAMAVVGLPFDAAEAALASRRDRLAVAASNHPAATVVSGDPDAVEALLAELATRNVFARRIKVDVASHSPQMDALRPALLEALRDVRPTATSWPMRSTVTGELVAGPELGAEYWARNLREPVRLWRAIEALQSEGYRLFVEVGPHPVLDGGGHWAPVASMRRDEDERGTLLEALGRLYAEGVAVNLDALHPRRARVAALPTYRWRRARYWTEGLGQLTASASAGGEPRPTEAADAADQADPADAASTAYAFAWQPEPEPAPAAAPASSPAVTRGPWLIVGEGGGLGNALASALRARGETCWRASEGAGELGGLPEGDGAAEAFARRLKARGLAPTTVVHLGALDGRADAEPVERVAAGCRSALHLAQALVGAELATAPRLWFVTQGAQATGAVAPSEAGVFQAPLWGLARSIAHEHPELWGGLVDLDPNDQGARLDALLRALGGAAGDHVAVRDGRLRRGVLAPQTFDAADAPGLRADATYLLTGGLGGIGLELARWMIARGARQLVLAGRRPPGTAARAAIAALEATGAEVRAVELDVADPTALAALLARLPDLRGVMHLAGVLDDATLRHESWARFARVLAPKAEGAWNLHRLTRHLELDHFVLFGSAAALLGSAGQGNYAAANAFLGALAHHRRALGLPALTIDWGAWAGVGMVTTAERVANVADYGLQAVAPAEALRELGRALGARVARAGLFRVSWPTFFAHVQADPVPTYLAPFALADGTTAAPDGEARATTELVRSWRALPAAERAPALVEFVRGEVGALLGFDEGDRPDVHRGLFELGMTSLTAVELRRRLQRALGREVSVRSTAVFDFPTIARLAAHLAEAVGGDASAQAMAPPGPLPVAEAAPDFERMSGDELERMLLGDEGR